MRKVFATIGILLALGVGAALANNGPDFTMTFTDNGDLSILESDSFHTFQVANPGGGGVFEAQNGWLWGKSDCSNGTALRANILRSDGGYAQFDYGTLEFYGRPDIYSNGWTEFFFGLGQSLRFDKVPGGVSNDLYVTYMDTSVLVSNDNHLYQVEFLPNWQKLTVDGTIEILAYEPTESNTPVIAGFESCGGTFLQYNLYIDYLYITNMDGESPPPASETSDTDGDGVLDVDDVCPGTPVGDVVDVIGCTILEAPEEPEPPTDPNDCTTCDGDGGVALIEIEERISQLEQENAELRAQLDQMTTTLNLIIAWFNSLPIF